MRVSVAERARGNITISISPLRNKINRPINDLAEHASERSGTSPTGHHDINHFLSMISNKLAGTLNFNHTPLNDLTEHASERSGTSPAGT